MTQAQKNRLAEIDAELEQIEKCDYDKAPQHMIDRHTELCKLRAEIDPPCFMKMFGLA